MGLAGRKQKQRIGNDPRNLSWADDASRFGSTYLAKLGWDSSKGLGVSGEGRLSALKVTQKLDMLGIGAAQQRDPNGLAWKQNKDFESVLRRLNETQAKEEEDSGGKKRKKGEEDEEEKSKKKKKKNSKERDETPVEEEQKPVEEPKKPYVPRVKAHRARNLASKNMASKSASAIAEILGIASTPASVTTSSTSTSGTLTPILDKPEALENLTTSSKSVADYFKERLAAKSGSATPTLVEDDDAAAAPRGGIGSSKLRNELTDNESVDMSMFASLKSSSFLAAASTLAVSEVVETPKKAKKGKKKDKATEEKKKHKDNEKSESKEEGKRAKALRKAEKAERRKQKEAEAAA